MSNGTGMSYKQFDNVCSPEDISFRPPSYADSTGIQSSSASTAPATGMTSPLPVQIVVVQAPLAQRNFLQYPDKSSLVCGAIQVGAGIASIILGIVSIIHIRSFGVIGFGIWCGVLFIISGSFGIVSASKKTSCNIITHMVMSIISATAAAIQFSFGVISVVSNYHDEDATVAVDALLVIAAVVEGIVAIIGSAISCKVICCSSNLVPTQIGFEDAAMGGLPPVLLQQQISPDVALQMQRQNVHSLSQVLGIPGQPIAHGPGAGYGY